MGWPYMCLHTSIYIGFLATQKELSQKTKRVRNFFQFKLY